MSTPTSSADHNLDPIQIRVSDFLRAGKRSRSGSVERTQRQLRRALMRLLREAEMDLGTELTLRVQNREIIVTAKSADQVTDESRVSAFEQCLADVLARRSSALQRLAE